ncbi:serine protease [Azospirillum canadense]|uniref:serine protease n=1 Tax=Azospirillum canadense TaxID=403962 RepID=UPI002226459C|nr:serine protease [Azospirillum canadense]MCW2235557.1 hypothetical protein [Azospirillum canadense]
MPLFRHRFLTLAVALLLAACATGGDRPQPPGAPPVARGSTEPVRFDDLSLGSMRRGTRIGSYVWSVECWPPYEDVYWTSARSLHENSTFTERFAEVLGDAGFDVAGRVAGDHERGLDRNRARYVVQGDLRGIDLELCRRRNWLTLGDKGVSGTGSVRVDWLVYEVATGRLVHRVATSGVARNGTGVPQGDVLLIEEAFSTAAEALGADPGFRAAVSRGSGLVSTGPAAPSRVSSRPLASTIPLVSIDEPSSPGFVNPGGASSGGPHLAPLTPQPAALAVRGPAPADGYADDPAAPVSAALVRVGEGRGVVIGELDGQAVILATLAGLDTMVAVHPAPGVALNGVVVARDAASGTSLVRVPARLTAAPLRGGEAAVSEPVTVLAKTGDVASSGMVASLRPDPRSGLDLIQVELDDMDREPAPGALLVDEAGNLLGFGHGPAVPGGAHGLSAFLPIGPMLTRLGVELTQAPAGAPTRASAARLRAPLRARLRAQGDRSLDGDRPPPT